MVYKLNKSLYGLKQAPRQWFAKLSSMLKVNELNKSKSDSSLFIKQEKDDFVGILTDVDDLILTGTYIKKMDEAKEFLHKVFNMKDLGELIYSLGIEVDTSSQGTFFSQRRYIIDLLH